MCFFLRFFTLFQYCISEISARRNDIFPVRREIQLPFFRLDLLPRLRRRFLGFFPVCAGRSPLGLPGAWPCVGSGVVAGSVVACAWGAACGSSPAGMVGGSWGDWDARAESLSMTLSPSSWAHPGSSAWALARGWGSGFGAGVFRGAGCGFVSRLGFGLSSAGFAWRLGGAEVCFFRLRWSSRTGLEGLGEVAGVS